MNREELTENMLDSLLRSVANLFASLGRALICLDPEFRVVQASFLLDQLLGEGAAAEMRGRPIAEFLGVELFGAEGAIRQAVEQGEVREGWRAVLQVGDREQRVVALTAAPVRHLDSSICDPRVASVVVLRPAEEAVSGNSAPTVFSGLTARSGAMRELFQLIAHLQQSEATVLLTGESGTGKEVVARAIHRYSPRHGRPFVAVNCAALPGELLESELFGHVRGAFTGAVRDRVGRFELASDGTLFLDEIGDVPVHLQVKLLRVLQERTFERLGESRSRTTDARIIAATNADLARAVREGRFREDLYYRLRVVPIALPPLRERREDIEPLATVLLARVNARQGRAVRLSPQALRQLLDYPWPGNVRELENALEYATATCQGQTVLPDDLPVEVQRLAPAVEPTAAPIESHPEPPGHGEAEALRRALDAHRWRREETARALGMSRTTLWRKMREHGLSR